MAQFGLAGHGSVINLPVYHHASANTAAYRDVENVPVATPGPVQGFAESGHVGIVLDTDSLGLCLLPKPVHQVQTCPTLNLVGGTDLARFAVDRPAKPHTNGGRWLMKLTECLGDDIQNPFGSFFLIYLIPKALLYLS